MSFFQFYLVLAGLLLVGLLGIVIGRWKTAAQSGRILIPIGFSYACLTAMLYGFLSKTTELSKSSLVFQWTFTPLFPSLGVYGGFLMFFLLGIGLIFELRQKTTQRMVISATLAFGSALFATFLAIRIPFRAQAIIDGISP